MVLFPQHSFDNKERKHYLDYVKHFPDDEDAPYAREQADTLAVKIAASGGKGA